MSRLPKRTFDPGHPTVQPTRVVYGRTYAFDWYVGCNSTFLNFGGKTWLVQGAVTVPSGLPRLNGPNSYNPVLPGYIIVSGKDDGSVRGPGLPGPLDRPAEDRPADAGLPLNQPQRGYSLYRISL